MRLQQACAHGTDCDDALARVRPLAVAIAYRMLGSMAEAEDVAQLVTVRVAEALGRNGLENAEAFATTVATRLSLDQLRSARRRREEYVGPWLPEPIAVTDDVAAHVEMVDSLSMAFLVVLESLSPVERAVFLLRDVFGYGFEEIAGIVGKNEANCRQLLVRARRRVREGRRRFDADPAHHDQLVRRFVAACTSGRVDPLVELLAADAVIYTDGGGSVRAATRPVRGRQRVATFLYRILRRHLTDIEMGAEDINGRRGFVVIRGGCVVVAGSLEILAAEIQEILWVVNPAKLRSVQDIVSWR